MKWMKYGGYALGLGLFGLFLTTMPASSNADTPQALAAVAPAAEGNTGQEATVPVEKGILQAKNGDPTALPTAANPWATKDDADAAVAATNPENGVLWNNGETPTNEALLTATADTAASMEGTQPRAGTKVGTDNTAHNQQAAKKQAIDGSPTPNPLL